MNAWLAGLLGVALGAVAAAVVFLLKRAAAQMELANATARAELLDQQLGQRSTEIDQVRRELGETSRSREAAEKREAVLNRQLIDKQEQFDEQKRVLADAELKLANTFKALGADALAANNDQFLKLAAEKLGPFKELLEKNNAAVAEIEKKRETAYTRLDEQIKQIATSHTELRTETGRLVTALRRPEVRGRWGEVQLRLVVEMAGMERHCDFDEQVTIWKGDAALRPDLVVNLPGGGAIPVDAKVPLDAYEQSLQPEADRPTLLKRHARHVLDKIAQLADKKYLELFERSPGVVVLFVSPESALIAALDADPELQREALSRHVLLATPTTLTALLRAIAYGWQQEDVAANARQISQTGRELYERLSKFVENLERVGDRLGSAASAYNATIGSLEGRVLASARKLKDLHATTDGEIESPDPIEIEIRPIVSPELKSLPTTL
jgi:DNA recombination protein RmuC